MKLDPPCMHMSSSLMNWSTHILVDEKVIGMLNEGDVVANNEPIEEVDNVQIVDMVVNRVGFKDVESSLVTLEIISQQIPDDVTPLN